MIWFLKHHSKEFNKGILSGVVQFPATNTRKHKSALWVFNGQVKKGLSVSSEKIQFDQKHMFEVVFIFPSDSEILLLQKSETETLALQQ